MTVRNDLQVNHSTHQDTPPDDLPKNSTGATVLLVDDDEDFIAMLSENLATEGFETIAHTDSSEARDWLIGGGACDIVLMDWYMPELSGISFLHAVRKADIDIPIIVLTGVNKDEIEDAALGCGAVDFVDKTRRLSVLLKRIQIALENAATDDGEQVLPEEITVGELRLLPKHCRAHWRDREIGLTVTEFHILCLMAAKPGVDFTYRQIYDVVHGEGFCAGDGEDGIRVNVRSLIRRIRQKFREIDGDFDAIENYPGFGYRWRRSAPSETPRSSASPAPAHDEWDYASP